MQTNPFDAAYWDERYTHHQTPWDVGYATPPLTHYFDQLENRTLRILLPGGGNSHEADYLLQQGFTDVTVVDISSLVIEQLKERFAEAIEEGKLKVVCQNFFDHQSKYDLMVEQTFFCALDPSQRMNYVQHTHRLLQPNGKLVGLLFNRLFPSDGPPFGGTASEYTDLFSPYFSFHTFEPCYNSIPPRQGTELFINFMAQPVK